MEVLEKELIKYFKSLGLEVNTNTKARGHQGFYVKNRIDVSKFAKKERVIPTLLHEFAHFIHSKLESDMVKTGGSINVLFSIRGGFFADKQKNEELCSVIEKELMLVTNFVDESSLCHRLKIHRDQVKKKVKSFEEIVKSDYPKFMRSKKFKEFDRYIKKSKAKYLLRYDRVKFITPFLRREEIFSIDAIEQDFPDMPRAFCAYLRLKSYSRKQARISRRINNYQKYYSKPAEMFARLVEGLYKDESKTREIAPISTAKFFELLGSGYYFELRNVFEMLQKSSSVAIF